MDGQPGNEANEAKNDTGRVVSAASSIEEEKSPITVNGDEKEGVPAEIFASDHDEENFESMKATEEALVEEAATSEAEENSGNELPGVNNITKSEDLAVLINEVNEQPLSHEESFVFEINSNDDDGPPNLHLETPEREKVSPTQVEEDKAEEDEPTAAPADQDDINYEEYVQLPKELCEERDKASQHNSQLQIRLAEYLRKSVGDVTHLEWELPVSFQLQEYESHVNTLADLKQQLITDSEAGQQQMDELSLQSQEKLDEVENEWRAFMARKQDVAVTALSQRLGKHAAQAKVESTLAAEQLRQDELINLRLSHIKLMTEIHRLEAELRPGEEQAKDPLQLQLEQLQAEKRDTKKVTKEQIEELLQMQKMLLSILELLPHIKEKLFGSQIQVKAKREQLAEVEARVARKRDLLTRTKQARNSLQRDNLRLKENHGLLGNRVLLRDFEDTVDANDHLEKRLENLKGRQADIVFSCGRWKKRPETLMNE